MATSAVQPVWWLAPLLFVIELIGHLARALSLSIRLFGNITGHALVLGMLFILIVLSAIPGFMSRLPDLFAIGLIELGFLGLLLSPISFAYAFGRYRLLEVEGRLRRGTRYVLVTGVLLALFF